MESHETTIKRVRSKGYMKQWVNKHRKKYNNKNVSVLTNYNIDCNQMK